MKKLISLLLAITMLFVFVGCGSSGGEEQKSVEDIVREETIRMVEVQLVMYYGRFDTFRNITVNMREISENEYLVSGSVRLEATGEHITDYSGTVTYNPASGNCNVKINLQ